MERQCTQSSAKLHLPERLRTLRHTLLLTTLLLTTLCLLGCDPFFRLPAPSAADYCEVNPPTPQVDDTILNVWAPDARQHCMRFYAPVSVAQGVNGITVVAAEKNINTIPFLDLLYKASSTREAPDLAFIPDNNTIGALADAGHLYPLNNCNLSVNDWNENIFTQRDWGYPFEIEVQLLFYSKQALRRIGWTEEQIANLPADIISGDFLINDLITIARQAIDLNAVRPGFAFTVHEKQYFSALQLLSSFAESKNRDTSDREVLYSNLYKAFSLYEQLRENELMHPAISQGNYANVTNRYSIRDALAHGKILFAHTVSSEWKRMVLDHIMDESRLLDNIGIALWPSQSRASTDVNTPKGSAILNFIGSYVIFSENASGKTNQAASCRVLEQLAKSDLHRQHATNTSQVAPEANGVWVPEALPEFTMNDILSMEPSFKAPGFFEHLNEMTSRIANNTVSIDQATALTVRKFQPIR